jgi:hypothetical protein
MHSYIKDFIVSWEKNTLKFLRYSISWKHNKKNIHLIYSVISNIFPWAIVLSVPVICRCHVCPLMVNRYTVTFHDLSIIYIGYEPINLFPFNVDHEHLFLYIFCSDFLDFSLKRIWSYQRNGLKISMKCDGELVRTTRFLEQSSSSTPIV